MTDQPTNRRTSGFIGKLHTSDKGLIRIRFFLDPDPVEKKILDAGCGSGLILTYPDPVCYGSGLLQKVGGSGSGKY